MNEGAVHRGSGLARIAVALTLALLGGCSCCNPPPQFQDLTFVVDDATATRISRGTPGSSYDGNACEQECNVLAGRADAGPADADLPDTGAAHPTLRVDGCDFAPMGASWLLTCSYGTPCPD